MYNCWGPSKLLNLFKRKNQLKNMNYFACLSIYTKMMDYQFGIFLTRRQFLVRVRRWREIFDVFIYIYLIKILKKLQCIFMIEL